MMTIITVVTLAHTRKAMTTAGLDLEVTMATMELDTTVVTKASRLAMDKVAMETRVQSTNKDMGVHKVAMSKVTEDRQEEEEEEHTQPKVVWEQVDKKEKRDLYIIQ